MEDEKIVEMLKSDCEQGIRLLEMKYENLIWYVLRGILSGFQEDMEECYQDVLLRCVSHIEHYRSRMGTFQTWLTILTRRIAIDRLRYIERKNKCIVSGQTLEDLESNDEQTSVEMHMIQREEYQKMYQCIERLRKRDREIFLRKYYYCQSVEQIASEMERTPKSIESHLYRIRKKLQQEMRR